MEAWQLIKTFAFVLKEQFKKLVEPSQTNYYSRERKTKNENKD